MRKNHQIWRFYDLKCSSIKIKAKSSILVDTQNESYKKIFIFGPFWFRKYFGPEGPHFFILVLPMKNRFKNILRTTDDGISSNFSIEIFIFKWVDFDGNGSS